jgi:hypothetical protein
VNEVRDRYAHRAAVNANRILAAQAAFGFELRVRNAVAFVNFPEIMRSQHGVAFGHGCLLCAF